MLSDPTALPDSGAVSLLTSPGSTSILFYESTSACLRAENCTGRRPAPCPERLYLATAIRQQKGANRWSGSEDDCTSTGNANKPQEHSPVPGLQVVRPSQECQETQDICGGSQEKSFLQFISMAGEIWWREFPRLGFPACRKPVNVPSEISYLSFRRS